ncbi:MAG: UvrD-helicase domain-containing protein [Deltaproteobacteria bacterium]|jgi:superfamily I DNA/RNA helicase|nr:UvrD-helicase domain-containing protein [Deltaproteobacteria bacterium]
MSWWVDYSKLSDKQHNIIGEILRKPNTDYWIQGFAGTGKTLILLHVMEKIAELNPSALLCYITYTNSLVSLVKTTPGFENISKQADILTYYKFLGNRRKYDFVFLDEVQDTELLKLRSIKSLSNHLYIAGDTDQQIYDGCVDSDDIVKTLRPQIFELIEIFRLTARLCNVAHSIMPETKITEGLKAATNPNASITLIRADNVQDEVAWAWKEAKTRAKSGDPSAILFSTHNEIYNFAVHIALENNIPVPEKPYRLRATFNYEPLNNYFKTHNIPVMYLGNKYGDLSESALRPVVYLMTYHSAKGLDFKNVFIPFLTANKYFTSSKNLKNNPYLGRRLLFVAVTRSRESLFLSYSGQNYHPYLNDLPADGVTRINLSDITSVPNAPEIFF